MSLIDVTQLTVKIGDKHNGQANIVVNGVSFALKKGEILGIVGESGCGKTMTAYALQGLLPRAAQVVAGSLQINGETIDLSDAETMRALRKKDFSMIFQNPMSCLNPLHKVGAQIEEALADEVADKRQRVYEMLREVQLRDVENLYHAYPHQLSGGMQQRIMIAMALISKPSFLIADEPTTALDVTTEAEIIQLILALVKKYDTTVIFISHDLTIIKAVANQVAVMYDANIVEYGATKQVFVNPQNAYTKALINAIPDPTHKDKRQLTIAEGLTGRARIQLRRSRADALNGSADNAPILSAEAISKVYKNNTGKLFKRNLIQALDNVSITLRRGETLGIVGESGSGKSTLAKIIAAIETATSGNVSYLGKTLADMSAQQKKRYRREVQIVFQDSTSSLNPRKKIKWLLEEPFIIHKWPLSRTERLQKISDLLISVGLDDSFLERYPKELSGGQRQRINIALALILEPTVIIADEPVSALDVSVQSQILNLMKKLQRQHGFTYLFISHDLAVVYYMSDQIAVMKEGRIVEYGAAEDVFYKPQDSYTKRLFAAKAIGVRHQ